MDKFNLFRITTIFKRPSKNVGLTTCLLAGLTMEGVYRKVGGKRDTQEFLDRYKHGKKLTRLSFFVSV